MKALSSFTINSGDEYLIATDGEVTIPANESLYEVEGKWRVLWILSKKDRKFILRRIEGDKVALIVSTAPSYTMKELEESEFSESQLKTIQAMDRAFAEALCEATEDDETIHKYMYQAIDLKGGFYPLLAHYLHLNSGGGIIYSEGQPFRIYKQEGGTFHWGATHPPVDSAPPANLKAGFRRTPEGGWFAEICNMEEECPSPGELFFGRDRLPLVVVADPDSLIREGYYVDRPDPKPDLRPDPRHYGFTICFTREKSGWQDSIGQREYLKALARWNARNARPMPKDFGVSE